MKTIINIYREIEIPEKYEIFFTPLPWNEKLANVNWELVNASLEEVHPNFEDFISNEIIPSLNEWADEWEFFDVS